MQRRRSFVLFDPMHGGCKHKHQKESFYLHQMRSACAIWKRDLGPPESIQCNRRRAAAEQLTIVFGLFLPVGLFKPTHIDRDRKATN